VSADEPDRAAGFAALDKCSAMTSGAALAKVNALPTCLCSEVELDAYSVVEFVEPDYDSLPGLYHIEMEDPAETPAEEESPAESATSEPPPPPKSPAQDASPCNQMQHDFVICEDVASATATSHTGLHSCPVPPDVLKARNDRQNYLELLDVVKSIAQTAIPKIEDLEKDDPQRKPTPRTAKKP